MAWLNGRRATASVLILAALLAGPDPSAGGASPRRAAEADSLHRRALAALARGTLDARRLALVELERASLLDPDRLQIWLDFGRLGTCATSCSCAMARPPRLVALDGGRGVYRVMAPGSVPVPAWGQVVRFPAGPGAILVAHLVTPGEPSDTLRGAWTVVGADDRVIARGSGALSASACDPIGQRAVDFTVAAPPGSYRVDLSVSGAGGRRGLVRLAVDVPPPDSALALSDLVMLCGVGQASLSPEAVRIEPDMARRITGSGPLSIYFEIDRLALGDDGRSRFAYTYSVVHVEADKPRKPRAPVVYQAAREELHEGARRRQLVTVPMRSVKRGRYELVVDVRDLVAGTRTAAAMRFDRD